MSYSTPNLLTDESRWLAKQARFMRMMIHNQGGETTSIKTVSSDYAGTANDYTILVDTTAGNVTVTLPTPQTGKIYNIKKVTGSNNVIIDPVSGLIDGSTTQTITTLNATIRAQFDGTNYYTI